MSKPKLLSTTIKFGIGECWLGKILVASTEKGVCAILLGDSDETLTEELQERFPQAELVPGEPHFKTIVGMVIQFVNDPTSDFVLPMDLQGTPFQHRVWEVMRQIPAGTTTTYADLAKGIGNPKSIRAAAGACAANPLAVAIPCHRVICSDGSLSGYRWGIERKENLLKREKELV